jgi:uncharacterized surface protein with fasciclin (FAS1) repeats
MPTETKYMLLWVAASFAFIGLIVTLWIVNVDRLHEGAAYGVPANTGALESPHTPYVAVEDRRATTITAIAEGLPDATRFGTLLETSGVAAQLKGASSYTVFVPTDRALRLLQEGTLGNMNEVQLKRFVQYHVVVGRTIDVNATDSGTVQALSNDMLNFSLRSGDKSARVNNSIVLQAYKGKNGIVYLINNALIPPVTFAP